VAISVVPTANAVSMKAVHAPPTQLLLPDSAAGNDVDEGIIAKRWLYGITIPDPGDVTAMNDGHPAPAMKTSTSSENGIVVSSAPYSAIGGGGGFATTVGYGIIDPTPGTDTAKKKTAGTHLLI